MRQVRADLDEAEGRDRAGRSPSIASSCASSRATEDDQAMVTSRDQGRDMDDDEPSVVATEPLPDVSMASATRSEASKMVTQGMNPKMMCGNTDFRCTVVIQLEGRKYHCNNTTFMT